MNFLEQCTLGYSKNSHFRDKMLQQFTISIIPILHPNAKTWKWPLSIKKCQGLKEGFCCCYNFLCHCQVTPTFWQSRSPLHCSFLRTQHPYFTSGLQIYFFFFFPTDASGNRVKNWTRSPLLWNWCRRGESCPCRISDSNGCRQAGHLQVVMDSCSVFWRVKDRVEDLGVFNK